MYLPGSTYTNFYTSVVHLGTMYTHKIHVEINEIYDYVKHKRNIYHSWFRLHF